MTDFSTAAREAAARLGHVDVLDHGYVKLVESWGADERIIEAARMSTQKGFERWGPSCSKCGISMVDVVGGGSSPADYEKGAQKGCDHDTKKPGDEKLLRFLYENKHATPFEFAGIVIEVQAPIFVFREWHRHRTQCLAGDTMIACVTPSGSTYQRSIKSLFELKHGGVEDSEPRTKNGKSRAGTEVTRAARRKVPWRVRVLPNCQGRTLRVLNEVTGDFEVAPMADVWESGIKTLYRITTYTGRTIKASAEHPFFTRRGWVKLRDLKVGDEVARMGKVAAHDRPVPPALRSGIGVWTSMMRSRLIKNPTDFCYLCDREFKFSLLELDHVVPVSADLLRALDATNLRPICPRCHKNKSAAEQPSREGMTRRGVRWERVVEDMLRLGDEMTYDIEVDGAHHNYVANGLVVHNSFNEMSARYAPLPDLNYVPTVERVMLGGGHLTKQAGAVIGAEVLTEETTATLLEEEVELLDRIEAFYQKKLRAGFPKELARTHLNGSRYSRMRASTCLRNWLSFLTLRMAPTAQWEIQEYARAVGSLIELAFPRTWQLFKEAA